MCRSDDRHDRDGVGHALGGQRGAVDRIDGDVDLGTAAVADLLAVEEHRRLVLLALADDDDALHRHGADEPAHRVDGELVRPVLVTAADLAGGGERSGLGHANEFEGQVAVGRFGPRVVSGRRVRGGGHLRIVASGCNGAESKGSARFGGFCLRRNESTRGCGRRGFAAAAGAAWVPAPRPD